LFPETPEKRLGSEELVCQVHASPSQAAEMAEETNHKPEVHRGQQNGNMLEPKILCSSYIHGLSVIHPPSALFDLIPFMFSDLSGGFQIKGTYTYLYFATKKVSAPSGSTLSCFKHNRTDRLLIDSCSIFIVLLLKTILQI
jgi:hypothetical protein